MQRAHKLLLLNVVQKAVGAGMIGVWLYTVYLLATSGMPVMRQMIGCMLSSMLIFGLLSLGSRAMARYRAQLEEVPEA